MSNDIKVSVIIVSSGDYDKLACCLESLIMQAFTGIEIFVVDNSVDQGFKNRVSFKYPQAVFCTNNSNLYYSSALNTGIEISVGEFVLCLNDDVTLSSDFIQEALKGFAINKNIGMVSGKILRSDKTTLDSTGLFLSVFRTAAERGYGLRDGGRFDECGYVFGVTGAVAFYRREMLRQLKINQEYFDDDFHYFYEDLDIAWRGKNFGWKAYYIPTAVAYHQRGATARGKKGVGKKYARLYLNNDLYVCFVINRYLTIIKNENIFNFLIYLPFIIIYDIFSFLFILFTRPELLIKIFLNLRLMISAFRKRFILCKEELR